MWPSPRPPLAPPTAPPSVGDRRVYAIGDVHGRQDLLSALLRAIHADLCATPPVRAPLIVTLGDYVDRGPRSRDVVETLIRLRKVREVEAECLLGNHEAELLRFLADPLDAAAWLDWGGVETLVAYGVDAAPMIHDGEIDEDGVLALGDAFRAALPEAHRAFFESLKPSRVEGDYVFVHAGLRPGVGLAEQSPEDMIWIRDAFLLDETRFEKVVVHGHTPAEAPHHDHRRIGIDTGAYATGVLTAVRLERDSVRMIQVGAASPAAAETAAPKAEGPFARLLRALS